MTLEHHSCLGLGPWTVVGLSILAGVACGSSSEGPVAPIYDAAVSPEDAETSAPEPSEADAAAVTPAGICSVDHFCWDQPHPQGNDLHSVWVADATHVFAVGELGTRLAFDGTAWKAFPSPAGSGAFGAVWGSSASDVWAVGDAGTIEHFDGSAWASSAFPNGDAGAADASLRPKLFGIDGSARRDGWAVGGGGTVIHFDGSAWSNPTSGTVA